LIPDNNLVDPFWLVSLHHCCDARSRTRLLLFCAPLLLDRDKAVVLLYEAAVVDMGVPDAHD